MNIPLIVARLKLFYKQNHRMPTHGEMVKVLRYNSKGSTYYVVKRLIEEGIVAKDENGKLVPKKLLDIPLLGTIKAGYPIPAEVVEEQGFNFHHLFSDLSNESFALTVSGDSMMDAGIMDGDTVIVDKTFDVNNGDVVAACVDNEWTVKYFFKDGEVITLKPANKKYPDIHPIYNLAIGGVVKHVIRSY
jgi:SOS regulatory protein LexA